LGLIFSAAGAGAAASDHIAVPAAVGAPEPPNAPATWAQTLERIATGVVTIQIDSTRAFDTEWNTTAQATGFVIDAKRGLILTNRHVVTPGPVTAQAIFLNREEVQLYPVYRDPVHDFGIYRYDPAKLRFIKPAELPLYPAGAVIGREIRVVGNDAGEQLSILAGTLARLDREAPEYGYGKYNDFNTFYYQAASSTSGGSSGSPVIDIEGRVVALNAGGATGAASSFYLPLTAVVRALSYIDAGKPVPRGTLETVFKYTPYDELKRLGLASGTEARMRRDYSKLTGMLVVDDVQRGSEADGKLSPGDILIAIDGKPVPEFFALERVLDENVGRPIKIEVQRGADPIEFTLACRISTHHARRIPRVRRSGRAHAFLSRGAPFRRSDQGRVRRESRLCVRERGNTAGCADQLLQRQEDREARRFRGRARGTRRRRRAAVRYVTIEDPRAEQLKIIRMDRRWFPARKCKRDDELGTWPCVSIAAGPAIKPVAPAETHFPRAAIRASTAWRRRS
jgi:pro-apoptotic serine protease NMA111